jgi:dihydrofolate reductase
MIKMILALGANEELGSFATPDGLPWHNPEDMKYFRDKTLDSTVVYGGNTFRQFQKMGMKFGLPQRFNYVISNTSIDTGNFLTKDITRYRVVDYGKIEKYLKKGNKDYWIIGGKSIYDQLHPYAEEVHLTRINQDFPDADVYLDTSWLCDFELVEELPLNDYSHVEIYKRKETSNET